MTVMHAVCLLPVRLEYAGQVVHIFSSTLDWYSWVNGCASCCLHLAGACAGCRSMCCVKAGVESRSFMRRLSKLHRQLLDDELLLFSTRHFNCTVIGVLYWGLPFLCFTQLRCASLLMVTPGSHWVSRHISAEMRAVGDGLLGSVAGSYLVLGCADVCMEPVTSCVLLSYATLLVLEPRQGLPLIH
jgi:hypothetical protein